VIIQSWQSFLALVVGVASNRSIAWGIAEAMANQGCEIALTYQNEKLKKRVDKCAVVCNSSIPTLFFHLKIP
jgi:enoyl-[acyl-carrier protein] reductase I